MTLLLNIYLKNIDFKHILLYSLEGFMYMCALVIADYFFPSHIGFLEPTTGNAVIGGYDIRKNLSKVRENLGLCPQHDILFDVLTVREHLEFFGRVSCNFVLLHHTCIRVIFFHHKMSMLKIVFSIIKLPIRQDQLRCDAV